MNRKSPLCCVSSCVPPQELKLQTQDGARHKQPAPRCPAEQPCISPARQRCCFFFSHAFPTLTFLQNPLNLIGFLGFFFKISLVFCSNQALKKIKKKKKEKSKKEEKGKKIKEKKSKCSASWKAKPSTYTGFPRACYITARSPEDESYVRRQRAAWGAPLSKHGTVRWANPAPVACYSAVKKCSPDCLCLIRLSCFSL